MNKVFYALIGLVLVLGIVGATNYSNEQTIYVEDTYNVLSLYPNANPHNLEPQSIPILVKEVDD